MSWQRELDVVVGVVGEAARLARDIRGQFSEPALLKADRSPVTVADLAVQAFVAHQLSQAFPEDPLVAEEDSVALRTPEGRPVLQSVVGVLHEAVPRLPVDHILETIDRGRGMPGERFWTFDPVDGTEGFVRGDQYVVALALIEQGRVALGVLGCPELALAGGPDAVGCVVYAARSHGAFRASLTGGDPVRLRVSSCREPRRAHVLRSFVGEHLDLTSFNDVIRSLRVEPAPTLLDSQAKHALIAAGQADLLIRLPTTQDFRDKIWDQAAGTILVEEAGGRVTDLGGAKLDFGCGRTLSRNHGLIASNGHLHDAVLEVLRNRSRVVL